MHNPFLAILDLLLGYYGSQRAWFRPVWCSSLSACLPLRQT